jgi:error-prone DNA polymerase
VLPLDVNESDDTYRIERLASYDEPPPAILGFPPEPRRPLPEPDMQGRRYGIRLSLSDVKGISDAEVASIIAGRPYYSLSDFWARARISRPIAERLVIAGGFDSIYGIGLTLPVRRRGKVTRRDLLLQVTDLERYSRGVARSSRRANPNECDNTHGRAVGTSPGYSGFHGLTPPTSLDVRELAAKQSQAAKPVQLQPVQLALDLGDAPGEVEATGLPEMSAADRVKAELEILGLDVSRHVVEFYAPFLDALGVTRAHQLMRRRSRAEVLVAGVKVATQTPPIRSGRRVIFLTLDDATGPIDVTFFEDAQAQWSDRGDAPPQPYAATLFHSWLLVVRGVIRRTGKRGISLRATGCWELSVLRDAWERGGIEAVRDAMSAPAELTEASVHGSAESFATRPVMAAPPLGPPLRYANGYAVSPYADIRPAGASTKRPPGKLWHSSPGSSGG